VRQVGHLSQLYEEVVRQVGHLSQLYEDARSEKYKISAHYFYPDIAFHKTNKFI
jgi:hypothetical protein